MMRRREVNTGQISDEIPDSEQEMTSASRSWPSGMMAVGAPLLCVVCGFIFGFAMEKGRVFEPWLIRKQMVMNKFVMMKMFLSAVSMGLFGMSILAMIPRTHRTFMKSCTDYYNSLEEKGVLSSIIGGLLLGAGLSISGSCPTSVFTQLGAMVPNAGYTFLGALSGTLFYGIFKPVCDLGLRPEIKESSNPWSSSPYFIMAMPLVAMFGILVCAFEILFPWETEVKQKYGDSNWIHQKAWPPYVAGALIGSLQVPLMLGFFETLGGSSSLLTMLSQVFVGPVKKLSPFIAKYRTGFASWWQIFFVVAVVGGAYVSASASGSLGVARGVPAQHAFIGGFLGFLGARIAGGCTSGHGISGMGFLSIISFITTAAMFGGAMATAFLMKSLGLMKI